MTTTRRLSTKSNWLPLNEQEIQKIPSLQRRSSSVGTDILGFCHPGPVELCCEYPPRSFRIRRPIQSGSGFLELSACSASRRHVSAICKSRSFFCDVGVSCARRRHSL